MSLCVTWHRLGFFHHRHKNRGEVSALVDLVQCLGSMVHHACLGHASAAVGFPGSLYTSQAFWRYLDDSPSSNKKTVVVFNMTSSANLSVYFCPFFFHYLLLKIFYSEKYDPCHARAMTTVPFWKPPPAALTPPHTKPLLKHQNF